MKKMLCVCTLSCFVFCTLCGMSETANLADLCQMPFADKVKLYGGRGDKNLAFGSNPNSPNTPDLATLSDNDYPIINGNNDDDSYINILAINLGQEPVEKIAQPVSVNPEMAAEENEQTAPLLAIENNNTTDEVLGCCGSVKVFCSRSFAGLTSCCAFVFRSIAHCIGREPQ